MYAERRSVETVVKE